MGVIKMRRRDGADTCPRRDGSAINLDRHRFLRVEGHSGNAASANRFKWLRIGSHRRVSACSICRVIHESVEKLTTRERGLYSA